MGDVLRFPVNMKFAWQEQMALDRELSSVDFHVGFLIGKHVNKFSGIGIVSMDTLALLIGKHVSTVKRSVAVLETIGHIKVHRRDLGLRKDGRPVSGGRVANRYEPLLKSRPQVNSFEGNDTAVSRPQVNSLQDAVSRPNSGYKQTKSEELGDHRRSPYPYKNPFQSKNQRGKSPITAAAGRLIAELQGHEQATPYRRQLSSGATGQTGQALELGRFEILVAQQLGVDHATLIDKCEQATIAALHRKFRAGVDIMHDIGDLKVKLSAENAETSQQSTGQKGGAF